MVLAEKIARLKLGGLNAVRLAMLWEEKIRIAGEHDAERFYLSLGHNHIERKGYDYDGLTLSREPKAHEALQVKAIAAAQDSAKERLTNLLFVIRNVLVGDALQRLGKLTPATYHKLIVTVNDNDYDQLHDAVTTAFNDGRLLIAVQRSIKQADDDYDDELDRLTSITASRLANDVQARVTGAAARFALLGQSGGALVTSVTGELRSASTAYVERAATGLANRTINLGRSAEAAKFEWERVEYSCLLDVNACSVCIEADGQTAQNENELEPAPNIACEGMDLCRCFHVFITT